MRLVFTALLVMLFCTARAGYVWEGLYTYSSGSTSQALVIKQTDSSITWVLHTKGFYSYEIAGHAIATGNILSLYYSKTISGLFPADLEPLQPALRIKYLGRKYETAFMQPAALPFSDHFRKELSTVPGTAVELKQYLKDTIAPEYIIKLMQNL